MFWGSKIGTDSTESEFGSGMLVVSSMDEERDEDDRHFKKRSREGEDEKGRVNKSFMNLLVLLRSRERENVRNRTWINPRLRSYVDR